MNAKQSRATRAAASTTLHDSLRKLLHLEMDALLDNPSPDTLEIRNQIDQLTDSRDNPAAYDQLFAEYLETIPQEDDHSLSPATLGRLYAQWDQNQIQNLQQLSASLNAANAAAAEQRLRTTIDETLQAALTCSSIYGATITDSLELMIPAAADPKRPVILHGPDGLKVTIRHWYQVLHAPLLTLAERGAINPQHCPVRLPGARQPVLDLTRSDSPRDQDSTRFRQLPGGLSLWVHHGTPHICRIAAATLRAVGHHPEDYSVQYYPQETPATERQTTMWEANRCHQPPTADAPGQPEPLAQPPLPTA